MEPNRQWMAECQSSVHFSEQRKERAAPSRTAASSRERDLHGALTRDGTSSPTTPTDLVPGAELEVGFVPAGNRGGCKAELGWRP
jgi:hypothetical protein